MRDQIKRLLLIVLFLTGTFTAFSQSATYRGYYVKDVNSWLGNTTQENTILNYTAGNGYTYIIFYDLGSFNFNDVARKNLLASFISRAKTSYGILQVGASGEIYSFFQNYIIPYNNSRANSLERFDVMDFEFEFWVPTSINTLYCARYLTPNGCSCDTAGAWKFSWKEFKKLDSLCARNGVVSEYYLGWPNKGQMQQVVNLADRILLHAYRPTDSDVYAYSRNRLIDAASVNHSVTILPIFSSEPSFMGPWLASHPVSQPFQTYASNYTSETGTWKQFINLQGYTWFTYSTMPQTSSAFASITASGATTFCTGGSVTLTANSGSAYLWSPGGQVTRAITVSTAGVYTVRVTNSAGANATSAPVTVTITSNSTPPTITASGPLTFCPGGSVVLTSSTAGSYVWSNGATTGSITVTQSGTYSVTAYSGSCSGVSAPVTVSATNTPPVPTVTSSGSLNICPGTAITLTSSAANGYAWSNGSTTRSIVVNAAGTYWVRAYGGPNCFTQSGNTSTVLLTSPTIPLITASGPTTLTASTPTVTLTSTAANTYLWSSGETTRNIVTNLQGSYRVITTGANGCAATSRDVVVIANGCTPPPAPTITLSGSNILLAGQTVTLTSSVAGGYYWSNGATTRSITVSAAGIYTLRAYNAGYCYSTSLPVQIYTISARERAPSAGTHQAAEFTAFPNPSHDLLTFSFLSGQEKTYQLKMYDVSGREIQSREIVSGAGDNFIEINVSEFESGMYFAFLISDEGTETLKILVE